MTTDINIAHPSAIGRLFVLDGKKIKSVSNVIEWTEWMRTNDRSVAFNKIGDIEVSTIFLGQDQGSFGTIPLLPLLFETIISGGEHDGKRWLYPTWEQAEKGHRNACELVVV